MVGMLGEICTLFLAIRTPTRSQFYWLLGAFTLIFVLGIIGVVAELMRFEKERSFS